MGTASSKQKQKKSRRTSEPVAHRDGPAVHSGLPRFSMVDGTPIAVGTSDTGSSNNQNTYQLLNRLCQVKPKYSVLQDLDWSVLDSRTQYLLFEAACELLDQDRALKLSQNENKDLQNLLKRKEAELKAQHIAPPAAVAMKSVAAAAAAAQGHTRSMSHDLRLESRGSSPSSPKLGQTSANSQDFQPVNNEWVEKVVLLYSKLEIIAMDKFKTLLDQNIKAEEERGAIMVGCLLDAVDVAEQMLASTLTDVCQRLLNPFQEPVSDGHGIAAAESSRDRTNQPRTSVVMDTVHQIEVINLQKRRDSAGIKSAAQLVNQTKSIEKFARDFLLREAFVIGHFDDLNRIIANKWSKRIDTLVDNEKTREFLKESSLFAWRAACLKEVELFTGTAKFSETIHHTFRCQKTEGGHIQYYMWPILRNKVNGAILYKGRVKI